jgi:hypothetical protein
MKVLPSITVNFADDLSSNLRLRQLDRISALFSCSFFVSSIFDCIKISNTFSKGIALNRAGRSIVEFTMPLLCSRFMDG